MARRWKILSAVLAVVIVIVVTALINRHVTQVLEDNYGVNKVYYDMVDIVPFEDDYQTYGVSLLNGYSMRVDKAEVMSYAEFLTWSGQTEDSMYQLLGSNVDALPEKLCLLTITLFNDNCDAEGFYLNDFGCFSETYSLSFDAILTIVANDYLLSSYEDSLQSEPSYYVGIYLGHNEETTVHIVYGYSAYDFSKNHWENLTDDPLWFMMTWFPTEKLVTLTLE